MGKVRAHLTCLQDEPSRTILLFCTTVERDNDTQLSENVNKFFQQMKTQRGTEKFRKFWEKSILVYGIMVHTKSLLGFVDRHVDTNLELCMSTISFVFESLSVYVP